jgi:hypothetical protein
MLPRRYQGADQHSGDNRADSLIDWLVPIGIVSCAARRNERAHQA